MKKIFLLACLLIVCLVALSIHKWSIRTRNQKLARQKFEHRRDVFDPKKMPMSTSKVQHSFVVSMTTSPKRLQQIGPILENVPWHHVETFYINVPLKFRNQDLQDETQLQILQGLNAKIFVNRVAIDTGPEMKLLGALDRIRPDQYIVVIDDDSLYPNTIFQVQDDAICAEELRGRNFEQEPIVFCRDPRNYFGISVHEGIDSFCVLRKNLTPEWISRVQTYKQSSPACLQHDDFTIGSAFHDFQFDRYRVPLEKPQSLDQSFQDDALHAEFGTLRKQWQCSRSIFEHRKQCPRLRKAERMIQQLPV